MKRQPALFISHGSPTLPLERSPATDFLRQLGPSLGRPQAILAVSAHWDTGHPAVSAAQNPETIHDFHGFPPELYRLRYPAPGAPQLADTVAGLLRKNGMRADDLIAYRERAPHAVRNHPTDEHLIPLFVGLGAATPDAMPERIHSSYTSGVISMDAYRFD